MFRGGWITRFGDGNDVSSLTIAIQGRYALATDTSPHDLMEHDQSNQ